MGPAGDARSRQALPHGASEENTEQTDRVEACWAGDDGVDGMGRVMS